VTAREGSVRERVEAALTLRRHAEPASPVAISLICRDAGISRANLYAHYPDLVQTIRATWGPRNEIAKRGGTATVTAARRPAVDAALLYLCLELRAEVEALRKRIECPLPLSKARKR
jgi:hypothetical protein